MPLRRRAGCRKSAPPKFAAVPVYQYEARQREVDPRNHARRHEGQEEPRAVSRGFADRFYLPLKSNARYSIMSSIELLPPGTGFVACAAVVAPRSLRRSMRLPGFEA